jgi:hypothetical protein
MTAAMGPARWWIQTPLGARRYDQRDRHGLAGISSREFVKRGLLPTRKFLFRRWVKAAIWSGRFPIETLPSDIEQAIR